MVKAARKKATLRDAVKLMKLAKDHKLTPGKLKGPPHEPASKAKPGAGGRFEALKGKISRKGDVRDPGAVAAAIGRAKFDSFARTPGFDRPWVLPAAGVTPRRPGRNAAVRPGAAAARR